MICKQCDKEILKPKWNQIYCSAECQKEKYKNDVESDTFVQNKKIPLKEESQRVS